LAISRLSRSTLIRGGAPLAGLGIGIIAHTFHNTLLDLLPNGGGLIVGSFFDWTGWFAMFIFILIMINQERKLLVQQLKDEIELGTLSPAQYHTACSAVSQGSARWNSVTHGSYQTTHRFYSLCAELAHKKRQFAKLGEERNNSQIIAALREELRSLSPYTSVSS
jgi:hypothetical protein